MINAWNLLYEEYYGTMATTYPIKEDNMTPCNLNDDINIGLSTASESSYFIDSTSYENITIDTSNCPVTLTGFSTDYIYSTRPIEDPVCTSVHWDDVIFSDSTETNTLNVKVPVPSIEKTDPQKYEEDKAIKALQNYISTTYNSHYTSERNDVQTLDLIESVGDAESFCRSNAIKYLSRYDKKGQAKRDILKALHYSLLLYYFSGQLHETPTRGYETF